MLSAKWYIGLDIANNNLYAVATMRRPSGWHLCNYWQKTLTNKSILTTDSVIHSDWIKYLQSWRKTLPKKISLRIALPVQAVLQKSVTLPNIKLRQHEVDCYVTSAITKMFPLPANELCYDYTLMSHKQYQRLIITAARRSDIDSWQDCLYQARLHADIIEIVPNAIRYAAISANCLPNMLLAHKLKSHWLLISPLSTEYQYSLQPVQQQPISHLIKQACKSLELKTEIDIKAILVSGQINNEWEPTCYQAWSPFSAFASYAITPPTNYSMYVIACGLALREQDYL